MKRKIIKQGHNTLTITLPSEWVKKLNLSAGNEIEIYENSGSLIINGKQNNGHKSAVIDITELSVPMIWRFFQSAYNELKVRDRVVVVNSIQAPLTFFRKREVVLSCKLE